MGTGGSRAPSTVVLLSGGLGGASLAPVLARRLGPGRLTVVTNMGDDIDWNGLRVCPDLDTVLYALAGRFDHDRGWGLRDDTFCVASRLAALGGDDRFRVGDHDLATHLFRTQQLRTGHSLTAVAAELASGLGIDGTVVLPATDRPARTHIVLADGRRVGFQDWYVGQQARDSLRAVELSTAPAAPAALAALAAADAVIVGPSNPVTSIGAILSLGGVRAAVEAVPTRIAVTPVVCFQLPSSPVIGHHARARRRVLATIGKADTPGGAAACYTGLASTFVLDRGDADHFGDVERSGMAPVLADVLDAERLADVLIDLVGQHASPGALPGAPHGISSSAASMSTKTGRSTGIG